MNIEFQSVTQGRKQIVEKLEKKIASKEEFTWIFTHADEKRGSACLFVQYNPVKTTISVVVRKSHWGENYFKVESYTFFPWYGPTDIFIPELKKRMEPPGHIAVEKLLTEDIAKNNETIDLDEALKAAFFSNMHEIWSMITVVKPPSFANVKRKKYDPRLDASQPMLPMFMQDLTKKE
jgi:hypothetical protein